MDFKFFIGRQFELEPTQLLSLRRKKFTFFHGSDSLWMPETDGREYYDITEELTRLMSERISEEIDNEIIRELTRTINGSDQIAIRNVNADYLQRYLNMGGNVA